MRDEDVVAEPNPYEAPRASMGPEPAGQGDEAEPVTTATYRLTAEDLQQFRGATASTVNTAVVLGTLVLMMIPVAFWMILTIRNTPRERLASALSYNALLLLLAVGVFLWMLLANRRRVAESPDSTIVTLTPEGLVIRQGDVGESRRAWAGIGEIRLTRNQVIFFMRDFDPARGRYSQTAANIVPLRAFATPEAADSFVRAARRWHEAATKDQEASGS